MASVEFSCAAALFCSCDSRSEPFHSDNIHMFKCVRRRFSLDVKQNLSRFEHKCCTCVFVESEKQKGRKKELNEKENDLKD